MLNKQGIRELAYVAKVVDITPMNADRLECIHIGGWHCVCGKGEFKVGDLGVFFEIDSLLPDVEPFSSMEFLKSKHFKIKTQKIRGEYSQGLFMPLNVFEGLENVKEGDFLTERLGVTYATVEDRKRKSSKDDPLMKYKRALAFHPQIARRYGKFIMKHGWSRVLFYLIFGGKSKKSGNDKKFPVGVFEGVTITDQERCLFGCTKVITDKGAIKISKIVNEKLDVKVLSMNADNSFSYKRILDYQKFENNEDVLTITYPFEIGVGRTNNIVCTKDHRLLTQRGYVHANELTLNDYLYIPTECYGNDCIGALYGMLLGDSSIHNDKRSKGKLRVQTTHGEKQLDYLLYKKRCFNDLGGICDGGKGGFGKSLTTYKWWLPVDGFIHQQLLNDFYINNKKIVTQNVLSKINEIGLAFWYMDDGCLSYRNDINPSKNPSIRLNTQGYSKKDNEAMCEMLRNRFNIDCHVTEENRKDRSTYYHIYITTKGTPKFLEIVTPYMCKSMAYKTIPSLEYLLETKPILYTRELRPLPTPILNIRTGQCKITLLPKSISYVYDLEVEDNHNFVTDGIISHNCENIPWVLEDKTPYIVTQKCDGSSATYILSRTNKKRKPFEYYVCSRKVRMLDKEQETFFGDDNPYWDVSDKYHIYDKLKTYLISHPKTKWVCWQGEICSPKIQKNPHHLKDIHFYCFHWTDSENGRLDIREADKLWKEYDMEVVPIVDTNYILPDDFEEFKKTADGFYESSVCEGQDNCPREGFVYYKTTDPKFSFKNVSREYLSKER